MSTAIIYSYPLAYGDLNNRDLYLRHKYQRSTGDVTNKYFTFSSNIPVNTVTEVSTLNNDNSGSYRIFCKDVGVSTTIDAAGTPTAVFSSSQTLITSTDLKTTGTFSINSVTTGQVGANLVTRFPTDGSVTQMSVADTSDADIISLDSSGNLLITGSVSLESDLVATGDVSVAGDTFLYGSVSVMGDSVSQSSHILFTGTSSSGFAVGTSLTNPLGTLYYLPTVSKEGGPAFRSSLPLLYSGDTTSCQVTSTLCVYNNTDSSKCVTIDSTNMAWDSKWRLRYDDSDDSMVFEKYSGGAWMTKSKIV